MLPLVGIVHPRSCSLSKSILVPSICGQSDVCWQKCSVENPFSQAETVRRLSRLLFPFITTHFFFFPTDHHQLSIILDILGTPSIDDFYAITSQRSREYIRALPFRKKKSFHQLFPKANPLAIDLMEKCLTFSPKRRIEVGEALKHPYLAVSMRPFFCFCP
jgi:serine/threonine protein kinase